MKKNKEKRHIKKNYNEGSQANVKVNIFRQIQVRRRRIRDKFGPILDNQRLVDKID